MSVLGLGAFLLGHPGNVEPPPADAPTLGVFYAGPVEDIETHVLASGQTLSGVLNSARITGTDLTDLILALRAHTNPRRLAEGSEVTLRRWVNTGSLRSVDLRLNADTTVRMVRNEAGWNGDVMITPTVVDTVFVEGEIEDGGSLYMALVYDDELDLPPDEKIHLASQLADVYGYKLDFTHEIQPGDRYRVVYEREARPDGTARQSVVLAAEIRNRGTSFPAIRYEHDDLDGGKHPYYDADGRSLRLAFKRYPVDYVRVTSSFSWRRYHPVLGRYRAHLGTDFGAAYGTPVRATGAGTVTFAGRDGGYGNVVVIRHPGGYTTRYAHLSRFRSGVRSGMKVDQDDFIGYVGATGLATGPHLHYELRKDGRALDARTVRLPGAPPIPSRLHDDFERVRGERMKLLDASATPAVYATGSPAAATAAGI